MKLTANEKRSIALKGKFFPRKSIKYKRSLKITCVICGKKLVITGKRKHERKLFYCKEHNLGNFKKGHIPWNKKYKELITRYCTWCGKKLLRKPHEARVYQNSFCNNQCLGKWLSEKYKSNKYFLGGWRGNCKNRDKNTCRLCNKTAKEAKQNMDVDHIIPYDVFKNHNIACQLNNLWCLCMNCHAIKSNWENHFSFNKSISYWKKKIIEKYPRIKKQLDRLDN